MKENKITIDNFEQQVLKGKRIVIVDFFAEWCGPCEILTRILDEIAIEYENVVKIIKINVDEEKDLVKKFDIHSIPALIFFKNGKYEKTIIGYQQKDIIISAIEELKG